LLMLVTLINQFVVELTRVQEYLLHGSLILNGGIIQHWLVMTTGEISDLAYRTTGAQHRLRGKDYQRLAGTSVSLATQQVEMVCRCRRLGNKHIVLSRQLQETLNACR